MVVSSAAAAAAMPADETAQGFSNLVNAPKPSMPCDNDHASQLSPCPAAAPRRSPPTNAVSSVPGSDTLIPAMWSVYGVEVDSEAVRVSAPEVSTTADATPVPFATTPSAPARAAAVKTTRMMEAHESKPNKKARNPKSEITKPQQAAAMTSLCDFSVN
jgi:hypothetical protein